MPIDRKRLVARHNPHLQSANPASPLTVGNGGFAFTADVTGFQTFYEEYAAVTPLCIMAHWGWHSFPNRHAHEEVMLTEYDFNGRTVRYAVEKHAGNEQVYDWLRQNPHRLNLGRIALCLDGKPVTADQLSEIDQKLSLWEGVLYSQFMLAGAWVQVTTVCAPDEDTLAFRIEVDDAVAARLGVQIAFPYGSPKISASDWEAAERHNSTLDGDRKIIRRLDDMTYCVTSSAQLQQEGPHLFAIRASEFSLHFGTEVRTPLPAAEALARSRTSWHSFWESGAAVDLSESRDARAFELERRIVLSQYLTAVQCAAPLPPQETGLTCNSWYGKFHLEMTPFHCGWMPLWGRGDLLERMLPWYHAILPQARTNAAKNGYAGARWPKMTGPEGIDSPSFIATLLIWQQPHAIWLLELLRREGRGATFLHTHWALLKQSADFMADFAVYNADRDCYELLPPLIPVQEQFDPRTVRNPAFEVEYWREGLLIAIAWAERLGERVPVRWREVAEKMVCAPLHHGVYLAHEACPETFDAYRRDHPSMLFGYGWLKGERMDASAVRATLERVLREWNLETLWGWDFGLMAMTATRLGMPDLAIDILLMETAKNSYVESGNNFQRTRSDLPLYLPGNGALLLAIALMCAGYDGCREETPGFPKDGNWVVRYENLNRVP